MKNINFEKIIFDSSPSSVIKINGKSYNYFGGTGYYELHNNRKVINSAIAATKKFGITSSSSRNSYGTTRLIMEVEKTSAEFFGCEDAVYLSSGFLTDIAAIQALANTNMFDVVFIDEYSHYSNFYAANLSGKRVHKFQHINYSDLERKLKKDLNKNQRPLIMTDGVFPVYGKLAPIDKYTNLMNKYNGILWIDDAHGMGILGKNGRGTVEHFKVKSKKVFYGGTLSKAFGGFGGIIPGEKKFISEIKNGFIQNGSTPPPSSAVAASLMGLRILKSQPELKNKLWENSARLKNGIKKIGIEVEESKVPIVAWSMHNKKEMKKIQSELVKKGYIIQFLNYMGAGKDGVLRIVVFSTHTSEQIDGLINEMKKII